MGAIDTQYTFTATDTITSTKMNNIIDQTTITENAIFGTTLEVAAGKLKIRSQGITSSEIAENAVTTAGIRDNNVTAVKLATDAVETLKIKDSSVTTEKIADSGVTIAKIADANITAAKLSGAQTGVAPIYGARAWMAMKSVGSARTSDGKTLAISNTSAGVCTVTYPGHGFKTGHQFFFQFSSLITSKVYTVTVVDATSFTVQTTYLTATTVPTVSIALYNVLSSGNVNSVSSYSSIETNPSYLIINLNEPMPDNKYAVMGLSSYSYPNLDDTNTSPETYNPSPHQTTNSFRFINVNTARYVSCVVFG